MPLKSYGVLKGKAIEVRLATGANAHYQVYLVDDQTDYRIAINVFSALAPSEVEYVVIEHFSHPITDRIAPLPLGFTNLDPSHTSGALDFIRGNLFERTSMHPLPFNVPGADNDLNEKIDRIMQRAIADPDSIVCAFGERWGPEPGKKDKFFGFLPGNGIHDIHMNQGNVGRFIPDDGVWQDGGLLVHFPGQQQWVAILLKFQSQSWHTDDTTGHRITGAPPDGSTEPLPPGTDTLPPAAPTVHVLPDADEPQGLVRIIAALVNSTLSPEVEAVTLLNTSPHDISLNGWVLVDTQKKRLALSGSLKAGSTVAVTITKPLALSNKGGTITLLGDNGIKVDGVHYTSAQAKNPGWTIVFK